MLKHDVLCSWVLSCSFPLYELNISASKQLITEKSFDGFLFSFQSFNSFHSDIRKECDMEKEILRPGYFLNQNRFEQSQLTPCPSLPRAQPLSCSAGLTMRSTSKLEDSVHQIILVRKFS